MFKIGEFSKIAQVSGRLLRYYDEIDLLKPRYIDQWTGYRYYTADQLPHLNRILALKELGLSLEQIQRLVHEEVDTEQIRRLYLERKAQIEQTVQDELARLQQVQLRLDQLNHHEEAWMPDIVIKQVPPQPVLSYRHTRMTSDQLYTLVDLFYQRLPTPTAVRNQYGPLFTILHSDIFTPEAEMDLEIGFLLHTSQVKPLPITDDITLTVQELSAVAHMATIVHQGLTDHPLTYNALGRWLEKHHYTITGPGRELLLENHHPHEPEKCVLEIQFPIERVNPTTFELVTSVSS